MSFLPAASTEGRTPPGQAEDHRGVEHLPRGSTIVGWVARRRQAAQGCTGSHKAIQGESRWKKFRTRPRGLYSSTMLTDEVKMFHAGFRRSEFAVGRSAHPART